GGVITRLMNSLSQSGGFAIPDATMAAIREGFGAGTTGEDETAEVMKDCWTRSQYLADPHTAVGIGVARTYLNMDSPMITLSTAHPAKFPDAVRAASGVEPALPLWLGDLMDRPERCEVLANDQKIIEDY